MTKSSDMVALYERADHYLLHYTNHFFPELIKEAHGSYVTTASGRRILDFTSGQMCATLGHNHPAIVDAVNDAGRIGYHLFSGMIHEAVANLAIRLVDEWMPAPLHRVMFVNTGSESNEIALRAAKLFTGGYEILAIGGSWHGVTSGAASVTFSGDGRRQYGPPIPGTYVLPEPNMYRPFFHDLSAEESALRSLELGLHLYDLQSTGHGAAIIIEPIISAGGIIVPSKSYMTALRKAADDRGMLLIFDEAQTAFGRLGCRHGADLYGVIPDIMTVSKTLGGGLPVAATITTDEIADHIEKLGFSYYTSHVSDPLGAIVANAVLDTIAREHLVERANLMGAKLKKQLTGIKERFEIIGDIRGEGLLLGLELVNNRREKRPAIDLARRITEKCYDSGLSMNIKEHPERGAVWRVAPPLTISDSELEEGVAILTKSIEDSL